MPFKQLLFLFAILISLNTHAVDRRGRLGVGMTQQLMNNMPAISFKLQRSRGFAFGGMLGLSTADTGGGHGAGLKIYRNLFDEPLLTFYSSLMAALTKQKISPGNEKSGFQIDLTLGSEFSFNGLQSLGLSFETGISANKIDDFVLETVGYHFIVAAIHFYL